jgi:hypothetical protein
MPRPGGFVRNRNSLLVIKPYWSIDKELESPAVLLWYETVGEGTIRSVVFY